MAGLYGVGGAVHGLAVEVPLRVGVAAVPDASPGQAAAPRHWRRRRLPGVLLVLEELVLSQLRWVVLILPPQMLRGFETPATVAAAVAAAGHRGQAAAALRLHAAGGRAAPGGRAGRGGGCRLPAGSGEETVLKSWTAPAAPPLARLWERLGQPRRRVLTAPREGRRGEGEEEEEERRGWHPARKYLKPGWSPGDGEQTRQGAVVGGREPWGAREVGGRMCDEDADRARGWEWDRE